jgi:hypothetical protein
VIVWGGVSPAHHITLQAIGRWVQAINQAFRPVGDGDEPQNDFDSPPGGGGVVLLRCELTEKKAAA